MSDAPLDLDAWEVLANAATGTEWRVEDDGDTMWINDGSEKESIGQFLNEPDAYFVAAARSAVPALIAECRALRAENARLRMALKPFADIHLYRDDAPGDRWTEEDAINVPDLCITPKQIRTARLALDPAAPQAPGKDR